MRAITAVPGRPGMMGFEEVPNPVERDGDLLVRGHLIGMYGTDRDGAIPAQLHRAGRRGLPCHPYRGTVPTGRAG